MSRTTRICHVLWHTQILYLNDSIKTDNNLQHASRHQTRITTYLDNIWVVKVLQNIDFLPQLVTKGISSTHEYNCPLMI